jgi:benzoyl-CoA-dihydrodiol lyase
MTKAADPARISFDTHPERYAHWRMSTDGATATLAMNVHGGKGIKRGERLKLNSYGLDVEIEPYDGLNRIRFEHPEVRCVVLTSARERMFCSGANIYMLGQSSHGWKVNFCKFTNETRNGMEDSSRNDGLKFLAAVNGTCAGGGSEIARAGDELLMIDARSSPVSLPEVPLVGVLPGTGGLTRITDKRKVRRDLADFFCTTTEGVRADRAKAWGLVDHSAKPQAFAQAVREHAQHLAAASDRPQQAKGVTLTPLKCAIDARGYHYEYVDAVIDRAARTATLTVSGPRQAEPDAIEGILAAGIAWWPLQMARELDDAILNLRTNELDIGTWQLQTRGNIDSVLAVDAVLAKHRAHWFVRETLGLLRRTLARLDVSSRTLFAIIDTGSCFAGTLAELALAADRGYMLQLPDDPEKAPRMVLSELNFGTYPMVNHLTRLATRFCGREQPVEEARQIIGRKLDAHEAARLGLVTFTPDDLDWDEEVRIALEERTSLSPDALTGMEASLRFTGAETMETRIFARLSAWQNWIFNRPNAVGEQGALKVFGTGSKAKFNWERI